MSDLSEYSQYDIERIVKMKIVEAIRQRNKELMDSLGVSQDNEGDTSYSQQDNDNPIIQLNDGSKFNTQDSDSVNNMIEQFDSLSLSMNTVYNLFRRTKGRIQDPKDPKNTVLVDIVELTTMQNLSSLLKINAEIDIQMTRIENYMKVIQENSIKLNKSTKNNIKMKMNLIINIIKKLEDLFEFKDSKNKLITIVVKNPNYNTVAPSRGHHKTTKIKNVSALSSNLNLVNIVNDPDLKKETELNVNETVYNLLSRVYIFTDDVENFITEKNFDLKIENVKYNKNLRTNFLYDENKIIQPVFRLKQYKNQNYPKITFFPTENKQLFDMLNFVGDVYNELLDSKKVIKPKRTDNSLSKDENEYYDELYTYLNAMLKLKDDEYQILDSFYNQIIHGVLSLKSSEYLKYDFNMIRVYKFTCEVNIMYYEKIKSINYIRNKGQKILEKIDRVIQEEKQYLSELENMEKSKYAEMRQFELTGDGLKVKVHYPKNMKNYQGRGFYNYDKIDSKIPSKLL